MYSQSVVQVEWNDRPGSVVDIGTGAYRRFQDVDGGSTSSASNDTECTTLLDEACLKNERIYELTPMNRGDRHRGSTKKKMFFCIVFLSAFVFLLMGNDVFSYGNDHGRVGTIAGWGLNTSRQTIDYVLPNETTTLIDPANVCSTEERAGLADESDKVYLLIAVCSSADNFDARQAIRETWGNVRTFNYDQFHRLHEHMRGEYVEPNSMVGRRLKDYMWFATEDEMTTGSGSESKDAPTKANSSHGIGNLNVKIIFLLGQSESNYVHQRQRSPVPTEARKSNGVPNDTPTTFTTVSSLSGSDTPIRGPGTVRSALFPNGADVDPAFNFASGGAVEVDELQQRIMNESDVFGDIIQESFIDSYNNLTLKTIMMLKWVTNNCDGKVKFIMKCDDDTFVNVPNLLHVLLGGTVPLYKAAISFYINTLPVKSSETRLAESGRPLLTGFLFCEAKPIGDTSSKWYSPSYMYNKDVYPNYLSGTAYLMNFEAAKALYRESLSTPIFHLEDVYLTGIVADRARIRRRHHPLFFYSYTKDLCALRGMISQHHMQPNEIRNAYDYITNSTVLCKGTDKHFTSGQMKLKQRKKCQ